MKEHDWAPEKLQQISGANKYFRSRFFFQLPKNLCVILKTHNDWLEDHKFHAIRIQLCAKNMKKGSSRNKE